MPCPKKGVLSHCGLAAVHAYARVGSHRVSMQSLSQVLRSVRAQFGSRGGERTQPRRRHIPPIKTQKLALNSAWEGGAVPSIMESYKERVPVRQEARTELTPVHDCLILGVGGEMPSLLFWEQFAGPLRELLGRESFAVSNRELCDDEKEFIHFPVCEGTSQPEPSCSAVRITANKNYRSKTPQEGALKKMHEEEHHQQMSILQLQLIQMNEVHVAKIQQIERECEMAEEEHRIKMEVLNKKKMYWERKLQTFTKEWPVSSFNRPFPNSP
ncbi:myb/SANT-like DNA-binding domain-containing protein 3 isoform X2 [Nannospalax galili]|uniref:myb/SANT-like DNA-binding domain-containing protein 3 isoform X2 n=1 Tax=Nannospalax galili TaxID=1026970 RepID=UPI00111C1D86|nr:myb/SANT-like DNA-binding domain-containing protein 3 isoform X2 [Nannospalax galili]